MTVNPFIRALSRNLTSFHPGSDRSRKDQPSPPTFRHKVGLSPPSSVFLRHPSPIHHSHSTATVERKHVTATVKENLRSPRHASPKQERVVSEYFSPFPSPPSRGNDEYDVIRTPVLQKKSEPMSLSPLTPCSPLSSYRMVSPRDTSALPALPSRDDFIPSPRRSVSPGKQTSLPEIEPIEFAFHVYPGMYQC